MAKETESKFDTLENIKNHDLDIIINATSVGMHPNEAEIPIDPDVLKEGMIVMDTIYNPRETLLLKEAQKRGCKIVFGYKMLLYQGVRQYELYTGKKAPLEVMEKALLEQ